MRDHDKERVENRRLREFFVEVHAGDRTPAFGRLTRARPAGRVRWRPATATLLSNFNPSVKQLGLVLMDPYFASVGVIALLLTAGLIGAVVAASSASESNPENEL